MAPSAGPRVAALRPDALGPLQADGGADRRQAVTSLRRKTAIAAAIAAARYTAPRIIPCA